jgi:hypothetical protein
MAQKATEPTQHASDGIWEALPILKMRVFAANITYGFVCVLDIFRSYDASVGKGRQMLRHAEENVSLWSPCAWSGLPDW